MGKLFLAALKACFTHRASSKAAALAFYTLLNEAAFRSGGGARRFPVRSELASKSR
jgi:hypothetical protein